MGVLISLVAIPLRENVPIFALTSVLRISGIRLECLPGSTALKPPAKDFKLLKFLILRVVLQLIKLYHKPLFLEPGEKRRIDSVKTWVLLGREPQNCPGKQKGRPQGRPQN
jgi:hypothetical protein